MSASAAIDYARQKEAEEADNVQNRLDAIEQSLAGWTSRVGEHSTWAKFLNTELENPNIGAHIQAANANASVLTWQGLGDLALDRTKFALDMLTMPVVLAGQTLALPFTNMYQSWQRFDHLTSAGVNVFGAALDAATMPFFENSGIAGVYTGFTHQDLYTGQTYSEGEAQWKGFVGGMTIVLNVATAGEFAAAGKAGTVAAQGLKTASRGGGLGSAPRLIEGGTGNAFAGHGIFKGKGSVKIPEGTSLTVWSKHGHGMSPELGLAIEEGNWAAIANNPKLLAEVTEGNAMTLLGPKGRLGGASIENYTLTSGRGLTLMKNSVRTE